MDNTNDVIMRNVNPETLEEQRCALGRLMAQGSPASIKDMNLLFGLESMLDAWSDEEYFKDNPGANEMKKYKVWVHIEEIDEENDTYEDIEMPLFVDEYDSLEMAKEVVEILTGKEFD